MRILVLDTAKKTGWAMIVGDKIVAYGLMRFERGVTGEGELQRHPQILSKCCDGIIALVDAYRPDFIVIEKPNLRGGSSFLTVGLFAVVQLITATHGIGFYSVHASTWQSKIPRQEGRRWRHQGSQHAARSRQGVFPGDRRRRRRSLHRRVRARRVPQPHRRRGRFRPDRRSQ